MREKLVRGQVRASASAGFVAVAALGLIGVSPAAPAQAAAARATAPRWTLVSSPDYVSKQSNEPSAVSCTSAKFCLAIDEYNDGQADQAGATRWNGLRWAALGDTGTAMLQDDHLLAISCVSDKLCLAVGYYTGSAGHQQTLTEQWAGSKWKQVRSPDASKRGDNELLGISCVSDKLCLAVGYYTDSAGHQQTLTEQWAGSKWKQVRSPDASKRGDNELLGISCVSDKLCLAVGYYTNGTGHDQTLTEGWKNSQWKRIGSPSPGGSLANAELASVSCTNARFCMAIGSSADPSLGTDVNLTERWNGGRWQQVAIASPGTQYDQLYSVSCTSARFCMTVGAFGSYTPVQVMADQWNGHAWEPEAAAEPGSSQDSTLSWVSCTSPRFCASVGSWFDGTSDRSLAEYWNGSHRPAATSFPDYAGAEQNELSGLSCTGANFCMAVGNFYDTLAGVGKNVADKWDGFRWRALAVPDVIGQANGSDDGLSSVSCTGPGFCMAVGSTGASLLQNLAERWNGTRWSAIPVPDTSSTQSNVLTSVSCTSSAFCVAAGYSNGGGGAYQALVLQWNGANWTPVTVPDPGTGFNRLQAVSCTSDFFCMAVGDYGPTDRALAEKWNGTSWTQAGTASPGNDNNLLYGVSCTSASFCQAVGTTNDGGYDQVLTERWNGSTFKRAVAPGPRTQSLLLGVSCTSARFCAAVGEYGAPNVFQSLTEEWNGTSWIRLSSPDTSSTEDNDPASVSCTSSVFCMADGSYSGPVGGIAQNLTEKW